MEWYVARNGTRVGPVTLDQLVDAARTGRLKKEDLVWSDGMQSWVPAATVPDFWHEPERMPAHSVWQRAANGSAARVDTRPNRSNEDRLVRFRRWLLVLSINLAIIALAFVLVAIFGP
jgi:hypothetical protein